MFVWTDLSTFDVGKAKRFYSECLDWRFADSGSGYFLGHAERVAVTGLYAMPERFQEIGMPSFWMSYIHVDDIEGFVDRARTAGGRVEVEPEPGPGGGRIALIRDPSGAGFTCYEGEHRERVASGPGRPVWNELHVSSLEVVAPFYENVFGWTVTPTAESARHLFVDRDGRAVGGVRVTPNSVKGDKEYWGIYFQAPDLERARSRIERAGGQTMAAEAIDDRGTVLAYDPQGAAFYLIASGDTEGAPDPCRWKWRAMVGLVLVAGAVFWEADWLWGLLFLLWVLPDLRRGSTHFMEHVEKADSPIVYWSIVLTWVVLSLYLLVFGWG